VSASGSKDVLALLRVGSLRDFAFGTPGPLAKRYKGITMRSHASVTIRIGGICRHLLLNSFEPSAPPRAAFFLSLALLDFVWIDVSEGSLLYA